MTPAWMLYGAYGFTGELLAREAVSRGHKPLLAGRNSDKLSALAESLGLDFVVFDLKDEALIARHLSDVDLVFHAAGPYTITAAPMIRACLASGTNYVDLTGEVPVFEYTFSHGEAAQRRGVFLISGLGFDVIPSDCLIAQTAARLPGADRLELGVCAIGKASAGTTKSMLEILAVGGLIRRDGDLVPCRLGRDVRTIHFPHGERLALALPWGDLATASRTTGIPNITTYFAYHPDAIRFIRLAGGLAQAVMRVKPLRRFYQKLVDWTVKGPDESALQHGRSYLWVRASAGDRESCEMWLETMEAYRFTAVAGVRAVECLLAARPVGALSPSQGLGSGFINDLPETTLVDALPPV
nr:saccharopine dehydrogenase NADP-binding domain-containing protein [Anaerolineae bacterium]